MDTPCILVYFTLLNSTGVLLFIVVGFEPTTTTVRPWCRRWKFWLRLLDNSVVGNRLCQTTSRPSKVPLHELDGISLMEPCYTTLSGHLLRVKLGNPILRSVSWYPFFPFGHTFIQSQNETLWKSLTPKVILLERRFTEQRGEFPVLIFKSQPKKAVV